MNTIIPNTGEASGRRRARPLAGRRSMPGDVRALVRGDAAGRRVIELEIDLPLDAPGLGERREAEPESLEFALDAGDVEALLGTRNRRSDTLAALDHVRARELAPAARLEFDRQAFFRAYVAAFSKLTARQKEGLDALLTAAEADAALTDVRWLAYMLATVQHECAGTWRPIEEFGKGKGRPYGKPIVVVDPEGKRHRNVYYGRGYVQLTWKSNYEKMGKLLQNRLLYDPALALQPSVAYRIMSLGMRRGTFTGKKLSDYIAQGKRDYVNARRIINALDKAQMIARNAVKLEAALRRSLVPAAAEPRATLPSNGAQPAPALQRAALPRAAALEVRARQHDELAWLSMFDGLPRSSWDALDLNRQAARRQTADGFNIPAKHQPQLWQWAKADATTLKWRPQGITGSREAGSPERPRWLAVSWYGRGEEGNAHAGARISLLDYERGSPSFLDYRHVLLVQDAANIENPELFRLPKDARRYEQKAGFAPVPIHAGGIAWVGDRLYVADTTLGLRVFDLTRLYAVQADPSKSRCGRDGDKLYAFNYAYVLPEIGYYRMLGTAPHSFVSVGSGARGRCLWVGQYLQKSEARAPTLFGLSLRSNGEIETNVPAEPFEPNDGGKRAYNVQGAYRDAGATWLSATGRPVQHRSTARLITQAPGGKGLRWRWPHGAEDLYLEAGTHTLWCLTEFSASESSGERFVFGVSHPTYAPRLHSAA